MHQLRFWLAFGSGANVELARQGHAYLHSLVPWIVLLLGVAVGAFLWALGRALGGQRSLPRYTLSLAALWLVCTVCLVAIYVSQELLEGLFATGHPAGLAGVFGYGGWWSIPAALCVGLVLAAVLHGARWVLEEIAQRRERPERPHTSGPAPAPTSFRCVSFAGSRRWRRAGRTAGRRASAQLAPLADRRSAKPGSRRSMRRRPVR